MVEAATRDSGFVLVAVLWMLALLAVVVLALSDVIRLDVRSKANLLQHAQAQSLADGAILSIAAYLTDRLATAPGATAFPSATVSRCASVDARIDVSVIDARGLVDLNAAPHDMLAALALSIGLEQDRAERFAATIEDFRDIDDEPTKNGAEEKDYAAAGHPFGPKNGPFENVDELEQVLDMSPDVVRAVKDLVTVDSHSPDVDLKLAPPTLAGAFADLATGAVAPQSGQAFARARLTGQIGALAGTTARPQVITVSVALASGGRSRRRAVIELSGAAALGFSVRDWASLPEAAEQSLPVNPNAVCQEIGFSELAAAP